MARQNKNNYAQPYHDLEVSISVEDLVNQPKLPDLIIEDLIPEQPKTLSSERRFEILATAMTRINPGIYVERMSYRPLGLETTVPDSALTFFIHIPYQIPITQHNLIAKSTLLKRTYIGLLVDPPIYSFVRENIDTNVEQTRFQIWRKEINKDPVYKDYISFCEQYNWYLFEEYSETQLLATVKEICKFNGKN